MDRKNKLFHIGSRVSDKKVTAGFDDGFITSNGGIFVLRKTAKRLRIADPSRLPSARSAMQDG